MDRKKLIAFFMVVFTVMASSFAFYFYQMLQTPNILVDAQEEKLFAIKRGYTLDSVRNDLYDLAYLQDAVSFSFLAKLKNYDKNVKPGMYTLQPDMSNNRVINLFASGTQTPVKVIFSVLRKLDELPEKIEPFMAANQDEIANVVSPEFKCCSCSL
ncbi:MAG: endolytic transglycosylase MltG [Bacteroidota bacterium]